MSSRGGVRFLLAALFLSGVASAQSSDAPETPQPELPFVESGKIHANDPATLDPGTWEIQPTCFYYTSNRSYGPDGISRPDSRQNQTILGTQVTYGVAEGLDVNVLLGHTSGFDSAGAVDPFTGANFALSGAGISDGNVGVRWRFYDNSEAEVTMAYLSFLTLPGSARGGPSNLSLSQDATSLDHRWVSQKNIGRLCLVSDLGFAHPLGGNNIGFQGGMSVDLAAGYQLNDALQPLVELNYATSWTQDAPNSDNTAVTVGFTYYPIDEVRLNMGVIRTLAGHNSRDGWSGLFFVTISP